MLQVSVAIPEYGCKPKPPWDAPSELNRSRKTKGLSNCPRSPGLIRRVIGPWRCPRVRCTMRRCVVVVKAMESSFYKLLRRQQIIQCHAALRERIGNSSFAHRKAFSLNESDIGHADEAEHAAQISAEEIVRFRR